MQSHVTQPSGRADCAIETVAGENAPPVLPAYPRDCSVCDVFQFYSACFPDRPAVLYKGGNLSYGDLDALTNRLARRLIARGAGRGSVVAFLTNRSVETIVGWLAALKCGAAYLPLDPLYPEALLGYMLEDCKPALVLAERDLVRSGFRLGQRDVLVLEDEIEKAQDESPTALQVPIAPMDTAYLMYTSGSTGRPKGVVIPHRGIVRLVRDQNYMTFDDREVYLLLSALAFDVSTWEVWGALLNGSRIAVVKTPRLSIDQIADAVAEFGVTSIYLTSALFHAVVDQNIEALDGLKQVLVGGDIMSPEHSYKVMERFPEIQLINAYGPTEATTYCVCYRLPLGGWGGGSVPIGVPLRHTDAYILDEALKPVPAGEVGMLWTAGDGVAKGYLNRPELTAERFREDPFRGDGSLMYLTGDLARTRPDGLIECLGRIDRQVKINGKRIELDEIELNLRQDPRLMDAIVVLRQLGHDEKRIAAFLKPKPGVAGEGLSHAVLDGLRTKLPAHMVPHEAIVVASFPLTANGKVDRTRLLELGAAAQPAIVTAQAAPALGLEERLAAIWARELKTSAAAIARDANFFDLGGSSLHMIKIHAAIERELGVRLPIADLFAHPRIADLAAHIEGRGQVRGGAAEAQSRAARHSAMVRRAQRVSRK
jgi:amino acid adenylation domain-containing protein